MTSKKGFIFLAFVGMKLINFVISAVGFVMLVLIAIIIFNSFIEEEKSYNTEITFLNGLERIIQDFDEGSYSFVGTIRKGVYISVYHKNNDIQNDLCKGKVPCICICQGDKCASTDKPNMIKCKSKFDKEVKYIRLPSPPYSPPKPEDDCSANGATCLYYILGEHSDQSKSFKVHILSGYSSGPVDDFITERPNPNNHNHLYSNTDISNSIFVLRGT